MDKKPPKLLGYDDILRQEIGVASTTQERFYGAAKNVPKIINTLLHLTYHHGVEPEKETPEGHYYQYCWFAYHRLPYTLRACYLLWTRGYYLEASQLLRHILEVLVKVRYLKNHTDQAEAVWLNKKFNGRWIKIKDMFDEVLPGYHEIYYGRLLSGFIHGDSAALLFKVELAGPEDPTKVDQGVTYKENCATYVLNQLVVYILGYLNFFPVAFPDGFASLGNSVKTEWESSRSWCSECIESHKKEYPESVKWCSQLEPIILYEQ